MTKRSAAPHIGLFDSGIGGLSVLRALRRQLPTARCSYIADTAYTPWGDRPADWVVARCAQLSAWLIEQQGAKPGDDSADLVLVACNTATTQAIAALRLRWPGVPFVGVEPGIKPAVAASHKRRVAVLATSGTLGSARLRQLVDQHAAEGTRVLQLPCSGLVEAIERVASRSGATDGHDDKPDEAAAALAAQLDTIAATLRDADVDTVVLGCTHYPLVADALQQRLGPTVQLIDTADAVVRRVVSLLAAGNAGRRAGLDGSSIGIGIGIDSSSNGGGPLRLLATGDTVTLQRAAQRWLASGLVVERLDLPPPVEASDSKAPDRAPRA
jgi:glutamate racemase